MDNSDACVLFFSPSVAASIASLSLKTASLCGALFSPTFWKGFQMKTQISNVEYSKGKGLLKNLTSIQYFALPGSTGKSAMMRQILFTRSAEASNSWEMSWNNMATLPLNSLHVRACKLEALSQVVQAFPRSPLEACELPRWCPSPGGRCLGDVLQTRSPRPCGTAWLWRSLSRRAHSSSWS